MSERAILTEPWQDVVLIAICFALAVPLSLGSVSGYEINIAFLLAPLVVYAFVTQIRTPIAMAFAVTFIAGIASCVIANFMNPDGLLWRHCLAVLVIMIPVSFYFLGRWMKQRYEMRTVVRWIALWSSVLGIAVAGRLFAIGKPFRTLSEAGYQTLDATFFGLPIFATFGALSLAHLLTLQFTLVIGVILDRSTYSTTRLVCLVGSVALIFLIIKSDTRSAQLALGIPIIASMILAIRSRRLRRSLLPLGASVIVAFIVSGVAIRSDETSRLFQTVDALSPKTLELPDPHVSVAGPRLGNPDPERLARVGVGSSFSGPDVLSALANGRFELIKVAVEDIRHSPFVGQGFGRFGRFTDSALPRLVGASTSTHVYFLTLLWKGGLLFALPFLTMIGLMVTAVDWRNGSSDNTTRRFVITALLVMVFLSLFWDVLAVASAGALAFFLFGMLAGEQDETQGAESSLVTPRLSSDTAHRESYL